ncbi:serine hydrolase domain-containing protein [Gemmatimonas sp.]|uniref:serine hydrolase domain-containing protein n=1 Tax=Gemmatimonas sp. TaxID=1962908 RepID=UPI0039830036
MRYRLTALVLLSFAVPAAAQERIDTVLARAMTAGKTPGLAAAIVQDGKVAWIGTYGFANVEAKRPVTRRTEFHIASTSKPFSTVLLMQLHAAGKFRLHDDINQYLPFSVRSPALPDEPVTFEMLLQLRSSIRDNPTCYRPLWSGGNGDSPIALGDFLREYLSAEGEDFSKENFFERAPGSKYTYGNTCFALIGYLAERISGKPFASYSEEALCDPLGLRHTHWFLAQTDTLNVALPFQTDGSAGYRPVWHGGFPDWPAGQLFATFLAAYTNNGRWDATQVIDSASIELATPRSPVGLGGRTWTVRAAPTPDAGRPQLLYEHAGGVVGGQAVVAFNPITRDGFIVLANSDGLRLNIKPIMDALQIKAHRPRR